MTVLVGIDGAGATTGVSILEMSETPGLGARTAEEAFRAQFRGKAAGGSLTVTKTPPESAMQVQAVSGATISSTAVTTAVNAARACWQMRLSPAPQDTPELRAALAGVSQ